MNRTDARAAEIEKLEADLARLEGAQFAASMSNGRYYSDGSKARDDAEIKKVRSALHALKKDQS